MRRLTVAIICLGAIECQQRAQTTAKAPAQAYSTAEFDPSINRVPAHFRGHNPSDLLNAAKSLATRMAKSEYETEVQWKERCANALRYPFFRQMTPESTFAIVIDPAMSKGGMWTEYNPEDRQLNVFVQAKRGFTDGNWRSVLLNQTSVYGVPYIGENAYGVKRRITKISRTVLELCYRVRKNLAEVYHDADFNEGLLVTLDASPAEALRIRNRLAAIAVFTIEPPYVSEDSERVSPTVADPADVEIEVSRIHANITALLIYNKDTGDVLKHGSNVK